MGAEPGGGSGREASTPTTNQMRVCMPFKSYLRAGMFQQDEYTLMKLLAQLEETISELSPDCPLSPGLQTARDGLRQALRLPVQRLPTRR